MSSPPLSQESRKQLHNSLGKNLACFEEQLRFSFEFPLENECLRFLRRVSFMSTDLCVNIRAELLCDNLYARRFYLKRLWINIVEAYRALYYSNSDEYSYLSVFLKSYPQCRESEEMKLCFVKLEGVGRVFKEISQKRNSFVHYDLDVWKTIDNLDWIDSEENPARLCCDLLEVFDDLFKIGKQLLPQTILDKENHEYPYKLTSLLEYIRAILSQSEDLQNMLVRVISEARANITFNKRVHQWVMTFNKKDVLPIINASMLIQIIRADLACALKACLVSGTQLEAMANLRMSVVSAYEGYEKLKAIYPNAKNVLSMLDKDERNYNVHYRHNSMDYIPTMYQSYYNFLGINKFLQMLDVLNELNTLQNGLATEIKHISAKTLPLQSPLHNL